LSQKARRVATHPSLRHTPIGERLRTRWDGLVHELDEQGLAPAVSTGKETIRVCLKGSLDENAIMFVILHELSHIACDSYGHTDRFWGINKRLLAVAKDMGVYTTHDPQATVCGSKLGQSPLQ
jgi:hypothetical protein